MSPADVPSLLRALVASDPGRPRVTWYGAGGERVELSAHVLDNWVAKTANLLVEELDAGPETRVRLDLPLHWRSVVWDLAVRAVGAEPVGRDDDADTDVDVVVAAAAERPPADGARLVVVALPALARSAGDLPAGALDYNAEVSGFGDVFVPVAPGTPPGPLPPVAREARVLVEAAAPDPHRVVLAALAADGSVVLCSPDVRADGPALDRIARAERVTATL